MMNIFISEKSNGLSDERINSATTYNYSITPELSYYGSYYGSLIYH